jgi:hypothetical protein
MRLAHARLGHLPLEPDETCLAYFPLAGDPQDSGPGDLSLVVVDEAETQGEFGVYRFAPPCSWQSGQVLDRPLHLFPNRDLPNGQVASRAVRWANFVDDSWCLEFQVLLKAGTYFNILMTQDADHELQAGERVQVLHLSSNGEMVFSWDDLTGVSGHGGRNSAAGIVEIERWHHVALQKPSGSHLMRSYLDGLLINNLTDSVDYPLSSLDQLQLRFPPDSGVILQELNLRSSNPYALVPFTPGPVRFEIGDTQKRSVSYM